MTHPTKRYLSLGAGVQSSATLLLAVRGRIPTFDAAIFADTGWEPANVYRQLARLTRIAGQAGIPVVRVSNGHIRKDALDSAHRFASMPLFTLGPKGERGMARALFTSQAAPCLKCHITDNNNPKGKTAPNFLIAAERLKPAWVFRWLLDPAKISPGTAMPSGLFRYESDHWVFAGPTPDSFKGYPKDHAELLVRYMFSFTPEELGRLRSSASAGGN